MSEENRKEEAQKQSKNIETPEFGKVAIVLVRGLVKVRGEIKQTIWNLGLRRVNQCVVVSMSPSVKGMLLKAKDYITWGAVDDTMYSSLIESRGEEFRGPETDSKGKYKYNFVEFSGKKYKKVFRLNPPAKGYGRKGVKRAFVSGGALGVRTAEKMADLLGRMM